jgi:hypothetical protein
MNKKDTFAQGFNTGYDIAAENISDLNSENFNLDDLDNFKVEMSTHESENYRQYTPFEFFAHDINECWNSDGLWDSYDNGVWAGITRRVKEFRRDNKKGFKVNPE